MAVGKYDTHVKPYLDLIKSLRIDGKTEAQICEVLEIGHTAWHEYKNKYTELTEALKISKETLIAKLEQTLFEQALAGNSTLLIFALKNLAPSKWAEKKESGDDLTKFFTAFNNFMGTKNAN